jgi:demethylmenaquinone methyltransferase/2-methoxy-6-polyprenyl-1,4-benzoquinol methylase
MLSKGAIAELYRKRARNYDFAANLYYLLGFREYAYRKLAVEFLNLKGGDTVVDIGCGTGLNFGLIKRQIGPEGKLVGVDMTDEMLAQARKRIERHAWSNVELVEMDAAAYVFPSEVNAIISSFAITLVPENEEVVRNGAAILAPGGRWVILDFKRPERWPGWLVRFGVLLIKPFGVTLDLADRHPWEAINKHLSNTSFRELYGGIAYIAAGEKTV